jgi:DNA mismatch repair protein MutL
MPSENVDVNVHPTKAEVRFRDPSGMFTGIQSAVRRALLAHAPVQGLEEPSRWAQQAWNAPAPHRDLSWDFLEKDVPPLEDPSSADLGSRQESSVDDEERLESIRTPILRLVGQIAASYLVAEGPDGLYLIDQHAAHERILFEKMMASFEEISLAGKGLGSQALLQPEAVQLPPASSRLIEEQMELLAELGFDIELFGPNTFLVRSIPSLLTRLDPGAALRALVEDFEENEAPLQDETEARIIARICKRAAVKAGQLLSTEEQTALITDLEACESPRTCPHGRPTMIHISVDLLERQFGRRGAR